MNVLILGGTGFISGPLVGKLLEGGHRVSIVTRGRSSSAAFDETRARFIVADRSNERDLRNAIGSGTFDAVYDMIAYEPRDSESAVRLFKGRTGRFIHCSTVSVYMVSNDVRCPITEDQDHTPLMEYFPRNPFGMEYGINKRKCEDVLWGAHDDAKFPVSMLRPTFVCGPGDPAKRDFFWIERILDGGPLLVPGTGEYAFQSVYVEDVAGAFTALLDHESSIGKAFNVAGEEEMSLNEYLRVLGGFLNRSPEVVHVDQDVFDSLPFSTSGDGDVFPFNVRRKSVFSLERVKSELAFHSTKFSEWMPATIEWFTRRRSMHSNGYGRRAEEVAFAARWKNPGRPVKKGTIE